MKRFTITSALCAAFTVFSVHGEVKSNTLTVGTRFMF
jgi:hypothetical protein